MEERMLNVLDQVKGLRDDLFNGTTGRITILEKQMDVIRQWQRGIIGGWVVIVAAGKIFKIW